MELINLARNVWRSITSFFRRHPSPEIPRVNSREFARYLDYYNAQVDQLALQLANRDISLDQWRTAMQLNIERLHFTSDVIGRGGLDDFSQSDLLTIQQIVNEQRIYLDRWTRQLMDQKVYDARQIAQRARAYGRAANATIQRATTERMGMPLLPFYPAQDTECMTNCGCAWEIHRLEGEGNWDVYWRRHKDDSCETCLARAAACKPLKIRQGVIQPFNRTNTIFEGRFR